MAFSIHPECNGCTTCVKRCPADAIHGSRNEPHDIDPNLCIDCGACGPVCTTNAIINQHGERVLFQKKKSWPMAFVDEINCVGCDKCVDECPFDALRIVAHPEEASFHGIVVVAPKKCTGCRICEWACPYDAIFVYPKDACPEWLAASALPRDPDRRGEIDWRKWSTSTAGGRIDTHTDTG